VFDHQAKAEVAQACLDPGVSVARIGMQYGVNANLLRHLIALRHCVGDERPGPPQIKHTANATFVPLQIDTTAAMRAATPPLKFTLQACLPNGVDLRFGEAGNDERSSIMRILDALSCSGSTAR
jgi:transposase